MQSVGCVCVCTNAFDANDLCFSYLAWWFILTLFWSRSWSKFTVRGSEKGGKTFSIMRSKNRSEFETACIFLFVKFLVLKHAVQPWVRASFSVFDLVNGQYCCCWKNVVRTVAKSIVLPKTVLDSDAVTSFKSRLKTHLFSQAFSHTPTYH